MNGFDSADRNLVAIVLVNAAKGLVRNENVAEEVIEILFVLAQDEEIERKLITQFVIGELKQKRNEYLSKSTIRKIEELDKILTGTSIWERNR